MGLACSLRSEPFFHLYLWLRRSAAHQPWTEEASATGPLLMERRWVDTSRPINKYFVWRGGGANP